MSQEPNTTLNRAKPYQLMLFPLNNGATNVYFVLILSYVAQFGSSILKLGMFASIMVTVMRVADAVTVMGNHCSKFIDDAHARTGILKDNPIHTDMVEAARLAKLAYIVNVVIDEKKKTVAAFAGDFEQAHAAGCAFLDPYVCVEPEPADIVITTNGGYPLDQNAYQSPKGMTAAEATVKDDGVIIMLATCKDGTGGDFFYHIIADEPDIETAYQKFLATPQTETRPDQWCSQILARIARKHPIIFVADPKQKEMIEGLKMTYAPSLDQALAMAYEMKGKDATLTCIPNGVSVVVKEKE